MKLILPSDIAYLEIMNNSKNLSSEVQPLIKENAENLIIQSIIEKAMFYKAFAKIEKYIPKYQMTTFEFAKFDESDIIDYMQSEFVPPDVYLKVLDEINNTCSISARSKQKFINTLKALGYRIEPDNKDINKITEITIKI